MNISAAPSPERELVVTRIFDAPRELVFRMWTEPDHVARWWGPRGFITTIDVMDVRAGGRWHHVMHGPDGRDYDNEIIFREVVPIERLVYSHLSYPPFDMTVTLADESGGKTRLTARMVFESPELREQTVRTFGAAEGLQETLGRLADYVIEPGVAPADEAIIRITRTFDAPRDLVWKASTEASIMRDWWGPHGYGNVVCEADVREGGTWLVEQKALDGSLHRFYGAYREVIPREKIVSTFVWAGLPNEELIVTTTFAENAGKTTLVSTTHCDNLRQRDGMLSRGAIMGMRQSYERLAALLQSMRTSESTTPS